MNREKDELSDEASRNRNQEASSIDAKNSTKTEQNVEDDMKRAAAKKLIERYFYQLTDGCGNPNCGNKFCASSTEFKNLSPNQAAAQAIQLFQQEAVLCERHPNKIPRTQSNITTGVTGGDNNKKSTLSYGEGGLGTMPSNDSILLPFRSESTSRMNKNLDKSVEDPIIPYLTEQKLLDVIDECEDTQNYSRLIRTLGEVYSSIASLSRSFLQTPSGATTPTTTAVAIGGTSSSSSSSGTQLPLDKESQRQLERDPDKDEDSCCSSSSAVGAVIEDHASSTTSARHPRPVIDIPSVRRSYTALFKIASAVFESALVTALVTLAGYLQIELQRRCGGATGGAGDCQAAEDDIVNVLVVVFEIPMLGSGDFLETAFPALCRAANWLPVRMQGKLAQIWSGPGRNSIRPILENLQQLVTLRVILVQYHPDFYIQEENIVTSATKLMKVLYYANILAGEMESPELCEDDSLEDSYLGIKLQRTHPPPDPLALELGVNVLDCRKPYLQFSEFYNEPLSDAVEMDKDFANYKSESGKFCFMYYSFILTPATKMMGLYFDNRIRMYSERRISYFQSFSGQPSNPYLRLKVRRDHIIDDALVELEMIAMENPTDLKKQLVVEFEGEQGIDEGGVSKEFFQLVTEEIFNPDYAMFTVQPEAPHVAWFNGASFETDAQFTLIGIVLGLAIYNNIILAVNFPPVLYRKLMGRKGSFEDLKDWNPTLYNSLRDLLNYIETPEATVCDTFSQTFRVSYRDVFGALITHDLLPEGDGVAVTSANRRQFVDLYADHLLNVACDKQFRAFSRGFRMVTDESPLELLFLPAEVELLICGSENFDFAALEAATEYDGGYTSDSQTIRDFWEVAHSLTVEDQRKLLQFTTGSDRVPLGGLSKLKLVIARNGPDSARLPTAHTCFNVLLLPEYATKEKLADRLLKAINYSKGFGML